MSLPTLYTAAVYINLLVRETAAVLITLLYWMYGSHVYKRVGMGNVCHENSRFLSDEFRQPCI